MWSAPSRRPLPLILIRGFGGLGVEDERQVAYQGFNDGTVYPHKRGENYIYEGLILRFIKSAWHYQDATNVVGFFSTPVVDRVDIPPQLKDLPDGCFYAPSRTDPAVNLYKVVIDPGMALLIRDRQKTHDPCRTLWVFRYYDLNDRSFSQYGQMLVRLIECIRGLTGDGVGERPKVNILAHSMGGLIVREAIQRAYPGLNQRADDHINKVVTLGTPHRGIAFQLLRHWIGVEAQDELQRFNHELQADASEPTAYVNFGRYFDPSRVLTVVGTNYRSYGVTASRWANRLFSVSDEYGATYNRSDGLVKQAYAQLPDAPRTFIHKCHGGPDSLITSREAFEVATRFLFGNLRVRLRMLAGEVIRGKDFFGKSEFFFGVSIKPRRVDFDLFHQSPEAENCYGPFHATDDTGAVNFSDEDVTLAFPWAGSGRLIWEGYLDTSQVLVDPSVGDRDLVFRLDFYIGERDSCGVGFSDNVVFRKQYYLRAVIGSERAELYCLTSENFGTRDRPLGTLLPLTPEGWAFEVGGTGFKGRFSIEIANIPEVGIPTTIRPTLQKIEDVSMGNRR